MISLFLALAGAQFKSVEIHFTSPTAHKVELIGDMTGWDHPTPLEKAGDKWSLKFRAPMDCRSEYMLVVDGKKMLNPDEPRQADDSAHGLCSVFQGLHYRFAPTDGPPAHPMSRSQIQIGSQSVIVYTPEDARDKPILVVMDGLSYEAKASIQNVVANLADAKQIRPAVLVLVPSAGTEKESGPGWASFGHFLLNDVLPAVRTETGASQKPQDLFLAGRGINGLAALRLAEQLPDQIAGGVDMQSPQFEGTSQGAIAATNLPRLAPTARIWLDWGRFEGGIEDKERVADSFVNAGRQFGNETTNEGYNWTAWRHRLPQSLEYLFPSSPTP